MLPERHKLCIRGNLYTHSNFTIKVERLLFHERDVERCGKLCSETICWPEIDKSRSELTLVHCTASKSWATGGNVVAYSPPTSC